MIAFRHLYLLGAALSLSACVSTTVPATRGTLSTSAELVAANSQSSGPLARQDGAEAQLVAYDIEAIRIVVPRSLKVSEANTFKPRADIVWRGEPLGDRHAQVTAIFQEAMTVGTAPLQTGRKADLEIQVIRFHALTEKTRYTFGGMHEMRFVMTLRDSGTGAVLDGPREVVADIKASGGSAAIAEEQAGRTQRVVTVERLAQVIRRELSAPQAAPMVVSRLETPPAPLSELAAFRSV
ncbi:MAG: hypothetical protein FJX28_06995 [Alphaproteobacteria bacterium]|nr:hypothetical protein [Alphaproteobacteria bacterium]